MTNPTETTNPTPESLETTATGTTDPSRLILGGIVIFVIATTLNLLLYSSGYISVYFIMLLFLGPFVVLKGIFLSFNDDNDAATNTTTTSSHTRGRYAQTTSHVLVDDEFSHSLVVVAAERSTYPNNSNSNSNRNNNNSDNDDPMGRALAILEARKKKQKKEKNAHAAPTNAITTNHSDMEETLEIATIITTSIDATIVQADDESTTDTTTNDVVVVVLEAKQLPLVV